MRAVRSLLFGFVVLAVLGVQAKDNEYTSFREYADIDEQAAFNTIKKMFVKHGGIYDNETVTDTTWSTLHVRKRSAHGYADMEVEVENIFLSVQYMSETGSKRIGLEIFSSLGGDDSFLLPDDFLHTLLWNRLEYAMNIKDEWIECVYSLEGLLNYTHPLCTIDKESLRLEE